MFTDYCPTCGEDRDFRVEDRQRDFKVRGETIFLLFPQGICTVCGEVVNEPGFGDPLDKAYTAYREKRGMLAPQRIQGIREQYGLSREAFAAVLGMSPATLYRYEAGSLQDDAHDQLIAACDDPERMRDFVERRKDQLTEIQRRRFEQAWKEVVLKRRAHEWFALVEACVSQSHMQARHFSTCSVARARIRDLWEKASCMDFPKDRIPWVVGIVDASDRWTHLAPQLTDPASHHAIAARGFLSWFIMCSEEARDGWLSMHPCPPKAEASACSAEILDYRRLGVLSREMLALPEEEFRHRAVEAVAKRFGRVLARTESREQPAYVL